MTDSPVEAATKLLAEVRGLIGIAQPLLRDMIGNTNLNVLMLRADELEAALTAGGWQPMSTCPKDGSRILVCDRNMTWETRAITPGQSAACLGWMPLPKPLPSPTQSR